jgi:hypothetical protein
MQSNNPLLPLVNTAIAAAVPFQLEDSAWVAQKKRVVIGHKTGLGKTFISILAWSQWPDARKVLIIGSHSSLGTWRRVLRQWCGVEPIIMTGASDPNWAVLKRKGSIGVWMCTAATFRVLMENEPKHIPVDLLIADELHKFLRTRNKTWECMKCIDSTYFVGATATWASKGPQDLFPILNYIDKSLFPSYWRYVETWCHTTDGSFGKQIIGVRNADKLKALLGVNYYRTRTWKDVGSQFKSGGFSGEPIIRRLETVPMSDIQDHLYEGMQVNMEARVGKQMILAQNSLDKLTKLLQIAVCPQILFPNGPIGGPIEFLTDKLLELERCVVFVPFKPVVELAARYLNANGYEREQYFLYGGITTDVCDATIAEWKARGGVIWCTIPYAQSFALDASDYCYFLGYDWDPNNNIQAEGRMRRADTDTQQPCLATYICPAGTVYEAVKEVVNGKVDCVKQVLEGYGL